MISIEKRDVRTLVPRQNREWSSTADGKVRIREPRFGRSALGRWLGRKIGRPFIEVTLDRAGSAVWLAIDGRATVSEIVDKVGSGTGGDLPDLEARIYTFLNRLARNRFILLE